MKIEKVEKSVANLQDKRKYFIHIRNLKQALNHILILKESHRVIEFNQNAWLKPYIDMNTKLRQKAKNNFEKDFFKLVDKAIENVRKHRDIKLVPTRRRRNYFISEPNYHTTKFFNVNFITNRNDKNSNINK